MPTRLPYSYADSTSGLRSPASGGNGVSVSAPSEARSPCRTLDSAPAS
jgi:hypothetical protein